MSATLAAVCQVAAHVFSVLYPGWEPDDATPCDCEAITWADHKRAGAQAIADAKVARDVETRRTLRAPGPNPDVCDLCGGGMSAPLRGRRTGLWIRTCSACWAHTHTTEAPAYAQRDVPPPRWPTPGPLFSSIETVTKKPLAAMAQQFDARMRAAGEREPGEDG